ncbi:hypothetical protein [Arthrobacter sp. Ld5]|uniref:hypothetical protein n=1 Tax=Arthrobacter sp. Ld5 TaxID=649152 RepID=UPI003EB6CEE6
MLIATTQVAERSTLPSAIRSGMPPRSVITRASSTIITAVVTAVLLGGCGSAPSQQGIGRGTQVAMGQVQGVDLKLVTEAAGEPARILGTLINTGTTPVEVVLRDGDDTATLTIEAEDTFRFAENPTIFTTTDGGIGDTVSMLISVPVTASEEAAAVPVYEGDLGGYYDRTPQAPES